MYWNPINSTQIPKIKTPPKLRNSENSNSETQKLRNSNSQTQKLRKSEFLSFRSRVSESDNFGQFWRWRKKSKTLRLQWSDAFWKFSCRIFFGQNRATQKLHLENSETQTQKLVFRVGLSEFRVRLSEFPKLRGFRAVRVHVDSNTSGPLNTCPGVLLLSPTGLKLLHGFLYFSCSVSCFCGLFA